MSPAITLDAKTWSCPRLDLRTPRLEPPPSPFFWVTPRHYHAAHCMPCTLPLLCHPVPTLCILMNPDVHWWPTAHLWPTRNSNNQRQ